VEISDSGSTKKIFEYPVSLLDTVPESLRPLLDELIEIGRRYPTEEALEEEVSELVYVMF